MTRENLKGLCQAIILRDRGNPDHWHGLARLLHRYVEDAVPFLTPCTAAELTTLFSHEIGEGPTDPDPGF